MVLLVVIGVVHLIHLSFTQRRPPSVSGALFTHHCCRTRKSQTYIYWRAVNFLQHTTLWQSSATVKSPLQLKWLCEGLAAGPLSGQEVAKPPLLGAQIKRERHNLHHGRLSDGRGISRICGLRELVRTEGISKRGI